MIMLQTPFDLASTRYRYRQSQQDRFEGPIAVQSLVALSWSARTVWEGLGRKLKRFAIARNKSVISPV